MLYDDVLFELKIVLLLANPPSPPPSPNLLSFPFVELGYFQVWVKLPDYYLSMFGLNYLTINHLPMFLRHICHGEP